MDNLKKEERAEMSSIMDIALEKFFNNVLECIVLPKDN